MNSYFAYNHVKTNYTRFIVPTNKFDLIGFKWSQMWVIMIRDRDQLSFFIKMHNSSTYVDPEFLQL